MREVKYVDGVELVHKTSCPISKNIIYCRAISQPKSEVQVGPSVAATSRRRPDQCARDQSRVRTAHLNKAVANTITVFNCEHDDTRLLTVLYILRGVTQSDSNRMGQENVARKAGQYS